MKITYIIALLSLLPVAGIAAEKKTAKPTPDYSAWYTNGGVVPKKITTKPKAKPKPAKKIFGPPKIETRSDPAQFDDYYRGQALTYKEYMRDVATSLTEAYPTDKDTVRYAQGYAQFTERYDEYKNMKFWDETSVTLELPPKPSAEAITAYNKALEEEQQKEAARRKAQHEEAVKDYELKLKRAEVESQREFYNKQLQLQHYQTALQEESVEQQAEAIRQQQLAEKKRQQQAEQQNKLMQGLINSQYQRR